MASAKTITSKKFSKNCFVTKLNAEYSKSH